MSINHTTQYSTTRIHFKSSVSVLCLRTLNSPKLCNVTGMAVKHLCNIARVPACHAQGKEVFVPTIPIISSDYTFKFKRTLFLVILSCVIRTNKSQGHIMNVFGLDLRNRCFCTHTHSSTLYRLFKSAYKTQYRVIYFR